MRLKKFQEKVKEQQEKVGEKVYFLLLEMLNYYLFVYLDVLLLSICIFRYKLLQRQLGCIPISGSKMLIDGLLVFLKCLRKVAIRW